MEIESGRIIIEVSKKSNTKLYLTSNVISIFYKSIIKYISNMKEKILISVFNKKGIGLFAKKLSESGYEIVASEGTGKVLLEHWVNYIPVQNVSQNPSRLMDCIQTISYRIPGGILFDRSNESHLKDVEDLNLEAFSMVICNFPPIDETIKSPQDFNIKHVDVGWPLMVRSAATNFKDVLVIVDPDDYDEVLELFINQKITIEFRKRLAIKAFEYTWNYDASITQYLSAQ